MTLVISRASATCHFLLEEATRFAHSAVTERVALVRNTLEKFQCLHFAQFGVNKEVSSVYSQSNLERR